MEDPCIEQECSRGEWLCLPSVVGSYLLFSYFGGGLVFKFCLTLCDPMNCSPPGSSVLGILQERILECIAISFSRGSSQPRGQTCVSCIADSLLTEPPVPFLILHVMKRLLVMPVRFKSVRVSKGSRRVTLPCGLPHNLESTNGVQKVWDP